MNLHKTMQATMLLLITGAAAVLSSHSCQADPQGSSNRNGSTFGMQAPGTPGQGVTTAAPQESTVLPSREVYHVVEQMPRFPGGDAAMLKYIRDNLRYPQSALEQGIQGRVIVQFVVGEEGELSDIKILSGIDPQCDQEAIRIIQSMPRWTPGKRNGIAVPVYYRVPITFHPQLTKPLQPADKEANERKIYQTVEQMPEFPGGIRALMQYIQSHLQPPPDFIRERFQGRVIVRFVVEPDGTITNAEVIKGLYPFCDREAVRVIESMPKWIPGRHNGVAVPVYYLVPVTFKI